MKNASYRAPRALSILPTPMQTKSLPRMAVPLMISFTARFLFSMVDMAYAAVLGEDNAAVGAIGFYIPFQAFYIAIWVGLSAGFTATISRAFGSGDEARVVELKRGMGRIFAFLIPMLLAGGVAIWFATPHLGLEPRLAAAFRVYATTMMIGMPLTGFWAIYPDSIVKAHHDTRSTMIAGLLSSATNITLNTVFVFVVGLGLFGIALGTVLSRIAGLSYAMVRAHRLERARLAAARVGTTGPPTAADRAPAVRAILVLAVPGALTYALTAFEGGVVNWILKSLPDSTTAIASYGVYHQLLALATMPAAGTSVAVVPFAARLLPQGRGAEVLADLRRGVLLVLVVSLALTTMAGLLFAEPVAGFFVKRSGNGDAGASPMLLEVLRLLPAGAAAAAPFTVLRPVFEAAACPRVGVRLSVLRFVVFSLPAVLVGRALAPTVGLTPLTGVVAGLIAASSLASALAARLTRRVIAGRC